MEQKTLVPDAGEVVVESVKVEGRGPLLMMLRASGKQNFCPQCHRSSTRVHSRYQRKLRDLPWEGIPVRIQLHGVRPGNTMVDGSRDPGIGYFAILEE
jgi:transposase